MFTYFLKVGTLVLNNIFVSKQLCKINRLVYSDIKAVSHQACNSISKDRLLSNITPRFFTVEEVTVHPSSCKL